MKVSSARKIIVPYTNKFMRPFIAGSKLRGGVNTEKVFVKNQPGADNLISLTGENNTILRPRSLFGFAKRLLNKNYLKNLKLTIDAREKNLEANFRAKFSIENADFATIDNAYQVNIKNSNTASITDAKIAIANNVSNLTIRNNKTIATAENCNTVKIYSSEGIVKNIKNTGKVINEKNDALILNKGCTDEVRNIKNTDSIENTYNNKVTNMHNTEYILNTYNNKVTNIYNTGDIENIRNNEVENIYNKYNPTNINNGNVETL